MFLYIFKMLLSLVLTFRIFLVASQVHKKHIPNYVIPHDMEEAYNIDGWVNHLHLQQCVFVATGENYFAVFLETRPRPFDEEQDIQDYFLGMCDADTLKSWKLCPAALEQKRPVDCIFAENGQSSPRVHRRLCELSDLVMYGTKCNCNSSIMEEQLLRVVGFPTFYRKPLPESLCGQNNVCGINSCTAHRVANRIYAITCDEDCYGRQPFCEMPEWESAKPREIRSFWTDWSEPTCASSDCESQVMEATCINRDTGDGDIDCLGPGTSCCPNEMENCKCHVFAEDGALKVVRIFVMPEEHDNEEMSVEDIINNLPLKTAQVQRLMKNKHKSIQKTNRVSTSKSRLKRDKRYWEHFGGRSREQYVGDGSDEQELNDKEDYDNENIVDGDKLTIGRAVNGQKQGKKKVDDDDDDDDDDEMREEEEEEDIMIEEETEESVTPTSEDIKLEEFNANDHKPNKNETVIDIPNRNQTEDVSGVSSHKISIVLISYCLFRCL